ISGSGRKSGLPDEWADVSRPILGRSIEANSIAIGNSIKPNPYRRWQNVATISLPPERPLEHAQDDGGDENDGGTRRQPVELQGEIGGHWGNSCHCMLEIMRKETRPHGRVHQGSSRQHAG